MIFKEKIEFALFFSKIQQCAEIRKEVLISFLSKTFDELILRIEQRAGDFITREVFSTYMDLPLLVSNKIFDSFTIKNRTNSDLKLSREDFVTGIFNLYFSSLDLLIEATFRIFDSKDNGHIFLEDVEMILSYMNTSDMVIKNEEKEKFISGFFKDEREMTRDEYKNLIQDANSNLFVILLIFLYHKQPFTEKSIIFYKENCYKENDNFATESNSTRNTTKSENNDQFIFKPSEEINFYMKYVGKAVKGTKRKNGSNNILSLVKCPFIPAWRDKAQDRSLNAISDFTGTSKSLFYVNSQLDKEKTCDDTQTNFNTKRIKQNSSTDFSHGDLFTFTAYRINSENKLKINKLVLIDKDLYIFRYSQSKEDFIFDRVLPLSGLYVTSCDIPKTQELKFSSFAFLSNFGSTIANITNIFFTKTKEENENCIKVIKKNLDIRDFCDFYTLDKEIGNGRYGKVHLGVNKTTEEKFAVKIIQKFGLKEMEVNIIRSEIDIMKYLRFHNHPNVIRTIDVFEDKKQIYIVMECLYGGSLTSYLINKGRLLTEKEVKLVTSQIVNGLEFLHRNGIVHRDLKTDNVMLTYSDLSSVKLVDFGLAKVLLKNEKTNEGFGSLLYTAPEILSKTPYNYKVDVWSLGVLVFYLSTGNYPFDGEKITMQEIASKICKVDYIFPKGNCINDKLTDFIKNCLQKCCKKRISSTQLLKFELL